MANSQKISRLRRIADGCISSVGRSNYHSTLIAVAIYKGKKITQTTNADRIKCRNICLRPIPGVHAETALISKLINITHSHCPESRFYEHSPFIYGDHPTAPCPTHRNSDDINPESYYRIKIRTGIDVRRPVYKNKHKIVTTRRQKHKSHNERCMIDLCDNYDFVPTQMFDDIDVLVIRYSRDGSYRNAACCAHCARMLRYYGIRNIYYTTDDDNVEHCRLKDYHTNHKSCTYRTYS